MLGPTLLGTWHYYMAGTGWPSIRIMSLSGISWCRCYSSMFTMLSDGSGKFTMLLCQMTVACSQCSIRWKWHFHHVLSDDSGMFTMFCQMTVACSPCSVRWQWHIHHVLSDDSGMFNVLSDDNIYSMLCQMRVAGPCCVRWQWHVQHVMSDDSACSPCSIRWQ